MMTAQAGQSLAQGKIAGAVSPSFWDNVINIVPTNPFAIVEGNMIQVVFISVCGALAFSDSEITGEIDLGFK